jgi:hypothetical protein
MTQVGCGVLCAVLQALEVCAEKKKRILLIQQEIKANPVSHKRTGTQAKARTRLPSLRACACSSALGKECPLCSRTAACVLHHRQCQGHPQHGLLICTGPLVACRFRVVWGNKQRVPHSRRRRTQLAARDSQSAASGAFNLGDASAGGHRSRPMGQPTGAQAVHLLVCATVVHGALHKALYLHHGVTCWASSFSTSSCCSHALAAKSQCSR